SPCCRLVPPCNRLVDRLGTRLGMLAGRKIVDSAAIKAIADADFYFVETIENIEVFQSQARDFAGPHKLADQHTVEPTATARAPGDGSKFVPALAKRPSDGVVHLVGRERPQSDAGCVGLANAQNIIDRIRT